MQPTAEEEKLQVCKTRRSRHRWTDAETAALLQGVRKHGHAWAIILRDPEFASILAARCRQDLRSRWRYLRRTIVGTRGWRTLIA